MNNTNLKWQHNNESTARLAKQDGGSARTQRNAYTTFAGVCTFSTKKSTGGDYID